jgi:copper homeostasis protein CutC
VVSDAHLTLSFARGGDFLYSDLEFESMVHDVRFIKREGANGIVVGILTADGNIDIERTKRCVINTFLYKEIVFILGH